MDQGATPVRTNGAARFGGEPFTLLDGSTVTVPEFNLDEVEQFTTLGTEMTSAPPTERIRYVLRLVEVIWMAVHRNHPDVTVEDFRQGLSQRLTFALIETVNRINGLVVQDPREAAPPSP